MVKKLRGFTLVELLVAMSIVAVLIGMSVFGIGVAQQNLRDNQRRDVVKNIAAGLAAYYSTNFEYPARPSSGSMSALLANFTPAPELQGVTGNIATSTTASQTLYCYSITSTGYKLGVRLETGDWFNLSSGSEICDNSTPSSQLISTN